VRTPTARDPKEHLLLGAVELVLGPEAGKRLPRHDRHDLARDLRDGETARVEDEREPRNPYRSLGRAGEKRHVRQAQPLLVGRAIRAGSNCRDHTAAAGNRLVGGAVDAVRLSPQHCFSGFHVT
jgi:hypothetical protein